MTDEMWLDYGQERYAANEAAGLEQHCDEQEPALVIGDDLSDVADLIDWEGEF